MSDKEMNLAILNKLYEIADKVFNEGVNVKEGNYTASDLAKMKDSAFKDGYLKTENKKSMTIAHKNIVEKDLLYCTDGECKCAIFRLLILCSSNLCIGS